MGGCKEDRLPKFSMTKSTTSSCTRIAGLSFDTKLIRIISELSLNVSHHHDWSGRNF